ncbi:MAG: hypothetical protein C4539_07460 [Ignavibacteriales bacterium]|nr:MAG: hypothetical protein C4539_07460 [Ignavibacteriales bacterium]
MKRIIVKLWLIISFFSFNIYGQTNNGLNEWNNFIDNQYYLKNFTQLNNPAFLFQDYRQNFLRTNLNFINESGAFRRAFDPENQNNYSVLFQGIKKLDSSKVLWGSASYTIDDRKNVNRSLKYLPYNGEAFFLLDDGMGNIKYNGPTLSAVYSQSITGNTILGLHVNYGILKGLKSNYSNTSILLRNVGFNFGVIHNLNSNMLVGLNVEYYDLQESFEGKGNELTQTEFFNYRGEKYFIGSIGSVLKEKLKKNYFSICPQAIYKFSKGEFILSGEYRHSNARSFLPKQQLIEFEEGYSSRNNWRLNLSFIYEINQDLSLIINSGFYKNYCWSKNSEKNLLLWEWNSSFSNSEATLFANVLKGVLKISAGYKYQSADFDSTKYIDNKIITSRFANHTFNFGLLLLPSSRILIVTELAYRLKEDNIIYAGTNFIEPFLKNIFRIKADTFEIDLCLNYNFLRAENSDSKRKNINISLDLKLSDF